MPKLPQNRLVVWQDELARYHKATIVMTKTCCIIVGAKSFTRNEYDGNILKDVLSHVADILGSVPETTFCDRGFRGQKGVDETPR